MKLDLITSEAAFDALQTEWNSLLPHNATNEIFLTWEWQHSWWQAYHPGNLYILIAHDEAGFPVGIAPWFIEQPGRTLRSIGCVEVTDYLDILAVPDRHEYFVTAVIDFLTAHASDYAKIDLCNIPGRSSTLEVMPRLLTERGFSVQVKQQEVCPVISLPADFEGYLAALDKKQRHEARRKLRRAEDSPDNKVEWYIVSPEHDLNAEIERFIALMAASHSEKAHFLENNQNIAFFRAMLPQLAICGWLQLSFLTVDSEPAAAYLNFDYNNRILVYNSGLAPDKYSHLSPGIVLLLYNIRYAIEQGRTSFDFLRGNEDYKYRMGGQDQPVMMLEATLGQTASQCA